MKKETRFFLAIAGGTVFLGIIACLLANKKNHSGKDQQLESRQTENDLNDLDEENQIKEEIYEPVSSWLL